MYVKDARDDKETGSFLNNRKKEQAFRNSPTAIIHYSAAACLITFKENFCLRIRASFKQFTEVGDLESPYRGV